MIYTLRALSSICLAKASQSLKLKLANFEARFQVPLI